MDDPDIELALYNKLVLKEIFVTPVGYDFLHRLQEYLYTIPYIRREDILPITVYEPEGMVSKEKRSKEEIKQKKKRQKNKEKPPEEEPGLSETVSHQHIFRSCFCTWHHWDACDYVAQRR